MKKIILTAMLITASLAAMAQDSPPQANQQQERGGSRSGAGRGDRIRSATGNAGQIVDINGEIITLKNAAGMEIVANTSKDTRFIGQDRQPISFKNLKVGDYVMVGGQTGSNSIVQARFVGVMSDEAVRRMQEMQENMGRTVIAGEIKEIQGVQVRVLRPDANEQVIEFDDSTSIKRGNESITLADVKVGDHIFGHGELKNGFFVPSELRIVAPGEERRRRIHDQPQQQSK
jgi:preprotein translocase subunit YajC